MKQMETIITTYAAADEEQRLSMFLTHRDLRPHFTAIDMGQRVVKKKAAARGAKQAGNDRCSNGITSACWGWLKQCCSVW